MAEVWRIRHSRETVVMVSPLVASTLRSGRHRWGGAMSAELATVSFRTESGVAEGESWTVVDGGVLSNTVPWRTFRWYKGQRHYSGVYWSATMRDHVVYESRLELSRLIFADFDSAAQRILAQPFLLKAQVDGKIRKHIPDYFLVTVHGPVVVDVKPEHLLTKPTVAYTFAWSRRAVSRRGWRSGGIRRL